MNIDDRKLIFRSNIIYYSITKYIYKNDQINNLFQVFKFKHKE